MGERHDSYEYGNETKLSSSQKEAIINYVFGNISDSLYEDCDELYENGVAYTTNLAEVVESFVNECKIKLLESVRPATPLPYPDEKDQCPKCKYHHADCVCQ